MDYYSKQISKLIEEFSSLPGIGAKSVYAADNLDGEEWDARSLSNDASLDAKDRIALIALEAARRIIRNTTCLTHMGA